MSRRSPTARPLEPSSISTAANTPLPTLLFKESRHQCGRNSPASCSRTFSHTRRGPDLQRPWPEKVFRQRSHPCGSDRNLRDGDRRCTDGPRSEEHTSELQSRGHLVCRLLLEKKKTESTLRR